jgi:hypothetical protein
MSNGSDPLRNEILNFLYNQVQENKIPQLKKGMVEDLENFINYLLSRKEAEVMAERMRQRAQGTLEVPKTEEKDEESS